MISNQEINEIIKIVKSLEVSGILIKDVTKTIKNEAKKQKGWIFGMLLCNFCASLLENNLGQEFPTSSFHKFWNTNIISKWN